MKCPHCQNKDRSMIEFLNSLTYVTPIVYKYLCNNCSKTFLSEEKPEGVIHGTL